MIRSYDEMLKKLELELNRINAAIEGWEKVVVKTKKDGTEYKRVTKACFENVCFAGNSYDPKRKELSITTFVEGMGYRTEIMFISLPTGNGYETLPPAEIRAKIQSKIETLKSERDSLLEGIKMSKEFYFNLFNAISEVRNIYDKSQAFFGLYNALREAAPNNYY